MGLGLLLAVWAAVLTILCRPKCFFFIKHYQLHPALRECFVTDNFYVLTACFQFLFNYSVVGCFGFFILCRFM